MSRLELPNIWECSTLNQNNSPSTWAGLVSQPSELGGCFYFFQPDEAVWCLNSCQSVTKKRHQSQKLFSRWIAVRRAGNTLLAGLSIIVMSENHNFQEKHVWYTSDNHNIFRTSVSKVMHLWSESHHTVAFTLYQRIQCQPTFLSRYDSRCQTVSFY